MNIFSNFYDVTTSIVNLNIYFKKTFHQELKLIIQRIKTYLLIRSIKKIAGYFSVNNYKKNYRLEKKKFFFGYSLYLSHSTRCRYIFMNNKIQAKKLEIKITFFFSFDFLKIYFAFGKF